MLPGVARMVEVPVSLVNRAVGAVSTIGHSLTSSGPWRATGLLVRAGGALLRRCGLVLVPHACALCGAVDAGMALDLCDVCRDLLPRLSPEALPGFEGFDLACAPFAYAYPVDHFVRELKFRGERAYARVLGTLLGQARAALPHPLPQLVVPVPLHVARLRRRGFNQAAEIARHAARVAGVPVAPLALARTVATAEQSALDLEARRANVRGAFRVPSPRMPLHVALVDDVVTTGSTAREAARVLREAGARRVELWAAAHAT